MGGWRWQKIGAAIWRSGWCHFSWHCGIRPGCDCVLHGEFDYDQLADGVWESAPLEAVFLKENDRLVGDEAGNLVIDDTALPKKSVIICQSWCAGLDNRGQCDGGK